MHLPSPEKLWQIPQAVAFRSRRAQLLLSMPLEVQAALHILLRPSDLKLFKHIHKTILFCLLRLL